VAGGEAALSSVVLECWCGEVGELVVAIAWALGNQAALTTTNTTSLQHHNSERSNCYSLLLLFSSYPEYEILHPSPCNVPQAT
jgi:hypothetical protein